MDSAQREGYSSKQQNGAAGETAFDCLAGMMFCYNMPDFREVDDCGEAADAAAWAADKPNMEALMRCYNE